tara:strand:+ start:109 stop:1173 length:1065 start_codon:yes stop_codon:yes gene_type:complete
MKKILHKILIVGSKGYLGSHIYESLSKDKNTYVYGIDNGLYGKTSFNKNYQKNFKKIDCRKITKKFLTQFNYVIFLAGLSNNPIDDIFPNKAYKVVENYTIDFAKKCKNYGIKFIFPSSCSVYGYGKREFNEKSKLNPLTYYSKNKVNIEKKLLTLSSKKFSPLILRFATVYGFSNSIRLDLVVNMFLGMVLNNKELILNSDGTAKRPHVSINYISKVIEYFINNYPNKTEIINVGEKHNNCEIIKLAKLIKSLDKKISIKFLNHENSFFKDSLIKRKDPRSYIVNFSKLQKITKKNIRKEFLLTEIKRLFEKFKKQFNNKKKIIKNINFYRLQKISYLIKIKKVNKNNLIYLK